MTWKCSILLNVALNEIPNLAFISVIKEERGVSYKIYDNIEFAGTNE